MPTESASWRNAILSGLKQIKSQAVLLHGADPAALVLLGCAVKELGDIASRAVAPIPADLMADLNFIGGMRRTLPVTEGTAPGCFGFDMDRLERYAVALASPDGQARLDAAIDVFGRYTAAAESTPPNVSQKPAPGEPTSGPPAISGSIKKSWERELVSWIQAHPRGTSKQAGKHVGRSDSAVRNSLVWKNFEKGRKAQNPPVNTDAMDHAIRLTREMLAVRPDASQPPADLPADEADVAADLMADLLERWMDGATSTQKAAFGRAGAEAQMHELAAFQITGERGLAEDAHHPRVRRKSRESP